jgi:hypothetical protein
MLQRVALSCARSYISRPPNVLRRYAAQPTYATPVTITSSAGDLSAPSASGAPVEVGAGASAAGEGDATAPTENKKRARAKRTPKNPDAVKEPKPRKKRTPAKGKEKRAKEPAEPLKPIEESATYLNYLGSVTSDQTTRDAVFAAVERVRPAQRPRTYHEERFEAGYAMLVKRLSDSFSRDQLHEFCSAHSLRMKEKNKVDLVEAIIEQHWGWPSLEQLAAEERRRTEVVRQGRPDVPSSESPSRLTSLQFSHLAHRRLSWFLVKVS